MKISLLFAQYCPTPESEKAFGETIRTYGQAMVLLSIACLPLCLGIEGGSAILSRLGPGPSPLRPFGRLVGRVGVVAFVAGWAFIALGDLLARHGQSRYVLN